MTCLQRKLLFSVLALVGAGNAQIAAFPDTGFQRFGVTGYLPVFHDQARRSLTFPGSWLADSSGDFAAWRSATRQIVIDHLFAEPPRAPFDPLIIEEERRVGYTARKLVFNLNAWNRVSAYLLIPEGKGPFPAVLLLHDHGARFDIGKEKTVRPFQVEPARLQAAQEWVKGNYGGRFIGDELARRGYLCLAVDALNWGDRGGAGKEGQQALASNLFNLGMSLAGVVAWEDLAALRFLASRPDVDTTRITAMGYSFGSFRAWQLAALSEQVRAAVCICWMAGRRELMAPGNNLTKGQSSYTTLHPGLPRLLDYPDVAGLACPRAMLFYNGETDPLFPQHAVQTAYDKMRRIWEAQGAGDRLVTRFWPGGHRFSREMQEAAFDWLDEQLDRR
ncbi:MAG TPA: alpha/beta hydrolase family protein [bacterium]|nr:alpha/beta hydrolase family protein [bacterium]